VLTEVLTRSILPQNAHVHPIPPIKNGQSPDYDRHSAWRKGAKDTRCGFALPRLQAHYSALKSSLILGLLVLMWHAPAFFVQGPSGREEGV